MYWFRAWLGGWAWQDVATRLRAKGHDVYPVTLTGLGERVHLARPEVDLETHITDVVNTIEWNDLDDVILADTATPASSSPASPTASRTEYSSSCTSIRHRSRTGWP